MRKIRILFLLIFFPFFSISTIFLLRDSDLTHKNPTVLAAQTSLKITISPTIFIPTFTLTPSPTASPTPTLKKTAPKIMQRPSLSLSPADYILNEINTYRKKFNLSLATSNNETCSFARTRAEEISNSFTHDGFNKRVSDKNLPYPSYQEVTENIAYNTDHTDVVKRWIASPGHEENLRKNTPFICIGKFGDYYAFEGWRP